jgi:hypothetical protein
MNTSRPARTPAVAPEPHVRLSLEPHGSRQGMLDGAWWPRSRDPIPELKALVGALTAKGGAVYRIGLNHATWDSHPRRVTAGGHVVKLGWYGPTDAHAIRVFGDRAHHLDLLLVPPSAKPARAAAAMATATDATSRARATEVLAAHGISTDVATVAPAATRQRLTAPLVAVASSGTSGTNGRRRYPENGSAEGRQS